MTDVGNDLFFVGLVAVKLQTEFRKTCLAQLFIDDIQGRQLFGNEQHLFSVAETFGNDIGNGLAFAGAGRALQDETLSGFGHLNGFDLAGIRIHNAVQVDERVRNGRASRTRAAQRLWVRGFP